MQYSRENTCVNFLRTPILKNICIRLPLNWLNIRVEEYLFATLIIYIYIYIYIFSVANKYSSAGYHEQNNEKTTGQIKYSAVTIKQGIKLVLQHSLCKTEFNVLVPVMINIENVGLQESAGVTNMDGTHPEICLKLWFESDWYFCCIT